jgi:glycogen(starch) synthase
MPDLLGLGADVGPNIQLTDYMLNFTSKSRRQRINQRNRVERLSPLLDWKNLGIEYSKARQLALRRAYPDCFEGEEDAPEEVEDDYFGAGFTAGRGGGAGSGYSVPGSPRLRGAATPGDIGTLTEEVKGSHLL